MEIRVERFLHNPEETIGRLYIDGSHQCYTLEDQHRDIKVHGDTRIPAGRYQIRLRTEGGFHARYLKKFGAAFHKGMLHVTQVPGFEFILIHIGNTDADTAGCLLVGLSHRGRSIGSSEAAYRNIYPPVAAALLAGKEVWIEYIDLP